MKFNFSAATSLMLAGGLFFAQAVVVDASLRDAIVSKFQKSNSEGKNLRVSASNDRGNNHGFVVDASLRDAIVSKFQKSDSEGKNLRVSASNDRGNNHGLEAYGDNCMSVVDTICGMGPDYKIMCDGLSNETVIEGDVEFALEEDEWTIFLPSDEAWLLSWEALQDISDDELARVFWFHFYDNIMLSYDDLECTDKLYSINNEWDLAHSVVEPDMSRTKCDKGHGPEVKFQAGNGNQKHGSMPKIFDSNYGSCNAAIHLIDHVMYPVALTELFSS